MNKIILFVAASVAALATLSGCSADEDFASAASGEGRVMVRPALNGDFRASRSVAGTEAADLARDMTIWIANAKGAVRSYKGYSNLPQEGIWLVADTYRAFGWAGDSVAASWTSRWFRGVEEFEVKKGSTIQVDLSCKIINTAVDVQFSEDLSSALKDYVLTVGHSAKDASLVFDPSESRRGYFMFPSSSDRKLTWTLTGTKIDGSAYTKTGSIDNALESTLYTIRFDYTSDPSVSVGGGYINVEVDDTPLAEFEDEVVITLGPSIRGEGFDATKAVAVDDPGTWTDKEFMIGASGKLTSVTIASDRFADLGIAADSYDLLSPSYVEYIRPTMEAQGISYKYVYDEEADASAMKLTFAKSILDKMTAGKYLITITATDSNGKTSTRVVTFRVGPDTDAKAIADAIDASSPLIWATSATISGTVLREDAATLGFNYRAAGTEDWTYVAAGQRTSRRNASRATVGSHYTVTLSGLTPATTYEVVAVADGEQCPVVRTFTTEAAAQLPNAGFETWGKNGSVVIPGTSKDALFWDSGNEAASLANATLTDKDTSIKHSGDYSAKLSSQKAAMMGIGKFAAGNLFVGSFLERISMDGVIGFGRPFTSRPKAVKIWVKYIPQPISLIGTSCPDPDCAIGKTDQGSIIVGVFNGEETYTTQDKKHTYTAGAVVYTKKVNNAPEKLFDKNASNVIGYAERYLTETVQATDGGLMELTIPIEYTQSAKATHIAVILSASRWGDYYAGGEGSIMWVDDVELVY